VFSVWSVPWLYNEIPGITKTELQSSVEGSYEIEIVVAEAREQSELGPGIQEYLTCDLKTLFMCNIWSDLKR
jgi:hypothetical protein